MDDVRLTNAMMKLDLFDGVDVAQVGKILATAERRTVPAGTVLCEGETIDETLFVFVDGHLRLQSSQGVTLTEVTRMRVIGEMGVLTGRARHSRVVAQSESTVLALTRDDLQELVHDDPELGQRMLVNLCNLLYERLHGANREIEALRRRGEQTRARLAELAPDDPLAKDAGSN